MKFKIISGSVLIFILAITAFCGSSLAGVAGDSVIVKTLTPLRPDSINAGREGSNVRIRWYPSDISLTNIAGSYFFENWYYGHTDQERVEVNVVGDYTGRIDRTLLVSKQKIDQVKVGSVAEGGTPVIWLRMETQDKFWIWDQRLQEHRVIYETFSRRVNIGTDGLYGDTIPVVLLGEDTSEELDLGISLYFHDGLVDTTSDGSPAFFEIDLQTYEGFHVWRKEVDNKHPELYPSQGEMVAIAEISREEYHLYSRISDAEDVPPKRMDIWEYFRDDGDEPAYPRYDEDAGRYYFEWIDENAFPGFKYYYSVSSYDRGYYGGRSLYQSNESYVCDNDSVMCSEIMASLWMSVDTRETMKQIYAVPNPFRTGSSAETTPYYHNYGDGDYIKFHNVPAKAKLRIYTVSGDLIWKTEHYSPDGTDGIITWDTKNLEGQEVGSGVFIFRCENEDGSDAYGKIVIIR